MSLVNKVCLVTGASRGIGRGIALALGSQGATVYITGRTLDLTSGKPGTHDFFHPLCSSLMVHVRQVNPFAYK